jgi:hypothetical protein
MTLAVVPLGTNLKPLTNNFAATVTSVGDCRVQIDATGRAGLNIRHAREPFSLGQRLLYCRDSLPNTRDKMRSSFRITLVHGTWGRRLPLGVWAIVAIGALSFVVWAHHMYVSGMNPDFGFFFATTTLIIAVLTAIKVYNWWTKPLLWFDPLSPFSRQLITTAEEYGAETIVTAFEWSGANSVMHRHRAAEQLADYLRREHKRLLGHRPSVRHDRG